MRAKAFVVVGFVAAVGAFAGPSGAQSTPPKTRATTVPTTYPTTLVTTIPTTIPTSVATTVPTTVPVTPSPTPAPTTIIVTLPPCPSPSYVTTWQYEIRDTKGGFDDRGTTTTNGRRFGGTVGSTYSVGFYGFADGRRVGGCETTFTIPNGATSYTATWSLSTPTPQPTTPAPFPTPKHR